MLKRSLTSSRLNIDGIENKQQQGTERVQSQQFELQASSSFESLLG
jgi:hypothetical protein